MRDVAGTTGANRVQRLSLIAAIGIGALAFTGCSAINPQSTTLQYSASDGVNQDLGSVDLRNVLIASAGSDAPGHLVGTFYNNADADITLTVTGAAGSSAELVILPGEPLVLNSKNDLVLLDTVSAGAGALEPLKLRLSGAGTDTTTINVPVMDGALAEYAALLPSPSPTAVPTSDATSTAEASDEAHAEATSKSASH